MTGRPRIGIAVPSYEIISARFANDLAHLVAYTQRMLPQGDVDLAFAIGAYVHVAREELLAGFLERGFTHVLWLETDVRFPREAGLLLLHHDVDVVAVNCVIRQPPHRFTAVKDGEVVITDADSTGLERVDQVGFGCCLMKTDRLRQARVPSWFGEAGSLGEDVVFAHRAEQAGISLHIDHDLSKRVKHIGQIELGVEHAYREYAHA